MFYQLLEDVAIYCLLSCHKPANQIPRDKCIVHNQKPMGAFYMYVEPTILQHIMHTILDT